MLVEMPDIIGWTQNNASKKLDESGINYSMQIIENDGQYAENCVVNCDVSKGTKFDACLLYTSQSIQPLISDSVPPLAVHHHYSLFFVFATPPKGCLLYTSRCV